MTELKRQPVKYVRDFSKSHYKKADHCYVCGSTENLDFHHYYSVTPLFERWCKRNKVTINSEEDILEARVKFFTDHKQEMLHETVTICNSLHQKLHGVYGKDPGLGTAKKQKKWIEKLKDAYRPVDK